MVGVCKNHPRDYANGKHDGEILRELGLPLDQIWEFNCYAVRSVAQKSLMRFCTLT